MGLAACALALFGAFKLIRKVVPESAKEDKERVSGIGCSMCSVACAAEAWLLSAWFLCAAVSCGTATAGSIPDPHVAQGVFLQIQVCYYNHQQN